MRYIKILSDIDNVANDIEQVHFNAQQKLVLESKLVKFQFENVSFKFNRIYFAKVSLSLQQLKQTANASNSSKKEREQEEFDTFREKFKLFLCRIVQIIKFISLLLLF